MPRTMNPQQKLIDEIGKALWRKGFRPVDTRRLVPYMVSRGCVKEGRPVLENERIFNLGLEGKRSNVFVFTQLDPINESVRVLMASPRTDPAAPAMAEPELAIREEFRGVKDSETGPIAQNVADRCAKEAAYKDPKEYWMQCHTHTQYFFDGSKYFDDGISNVADVLRRAMLYNSDVLVLTTHNSIDLEKFAVLDAVCRMMGVTAVMGLELTAPLLQKHVNGPHLLLMLGNRDAALAAQARILGLREGDLRMPSYFRSLDGAMLFNGMLRALDDLRRGGHAALGAAHPFNFSSKALPIKAVGLLSAVDEGQLSLQTAITLAKTMDFVEVWNRSLSPDPMKINDPELRKWIAGQVLSRILENGSIPGAAEAKERFNLADIMSCNVNNLALGLFLEKEAKVGAIFGTDDHCTPPLDWRYLRGGYMEAGFTFFRSDRKLGAEEIVRRISDRSLGLSAHVYTAATERGLQIADARTRVPDDLKGDWDKLKARHFLNYVKVLAADAFGFLGKGEPGMIGKMDK